MKCLRSEFGSVIFLEKKDSKTAKIIKKCCASRDDKEMMRIINSFADLKVCMYPTEENMLNPIIVSKGDNPEKIIIPSNALITLFGTSKAAMLTMSGAKKDNLREIDEDKFINCYNNNEPMSFQDMIDQLESAWSDFNQGYERERVKDETDPEIIRKQDEELHKIFGS